MEHINLGKEVLMEWFCEQSFKGKKKFLSFQIKSRKKHRYL